MPKKPLILMTTSLDSKLEREILKKNARVKVVRPSALKKEIAQSDALITTLDVPIDKTILDLAPNLKVIGNDAVGVNNIDLDACRERGIKVVNTPDVLTRATAELALTLLLATARRVFEGEKLCRNRKFKGWDHHLLQGLELRGRQAVLVGKGRIGKEFGRLLKALGVKVTFVTRSDSSEKIRTKLRSAQILSLHCPLNKDTLHWLNRTRIGLLPKDSIVLNLARGPVVDEKALVVALKKKKIFGAGLDVYENEPKIPSSLARLPNVTLLPHLGSATVETRRAMAQLVMTGVISVLSGKTPRNQVKL